MKPAAPVTSTFNAVLRWRSLEPCVGGALRQDVLHVEDHHVRATERADALRPQRREFAMRDREDDRVVGAALGLRHDPNSILVLRLASVGPRIMDVDAAAEALKLLD